MDLKEQGFTNYFRRHPWEEKRREFFSHLAVKYVKKKNPSILDFGAGDCWMGYNIAKSLAKPNESTPSLTFVDANFTSTVISEVQKLLDSSIQKNFVEKPKKGDVDLVLALDVFEHVEDDVSGLKSIREMSLGSESIVIMSLPSIKSAYGLHDKRLGHFRRYSGNEARKLVTSAGLQILESGYLFSSLILARYIENLRVSLGGELPERLKMPEKKDLFERIFEVVLAGDTMVESIFSYKIPGLTWWSVCKRAESA